MANSHQTTFRTLLKLHFDFTMPHFALMFRFRPWQLQDLSPHGAALSCFRVEAQWHLNFSHWVAKSRHSSLACLYRSYNAELLSYDFSNLKWIKYVNHGFAPFCSQDFGELPRWLHVSLACFSQLSVACPVGEFARGNGRTTSMISAKIILSNSKCFWWHCCCMLVTDPWSLWNTARVSLPLP